MKIHQLPMGARFEFEGVEYTKTGPLLGTGPGGQRLIPKYAVLKPLDAAAAAAPKASTVARAAVQAALARYHARCAALVPAEGQAQLEAAYAELLKSLD